MKYCLPGTNWSVVNVWVHLNSPVVCGKINPYPAPGDSIPLVSPIIFPALSLNLAQADDWIPPIGPELFLTNIFAFKVNVTCSVIIPLDIWNLLVGDVILNPEFDPVEIIWWNLTSSNDVGVV